MEGTLAPETEQAALKIQSAYRGFQARKDVSELKYLERRKIATDYMAKHEIADTFQVLLMKVIFARPSDPREFLIQELKKMSSKSSSPLIEEQDLDTIFSMIDNTSRGFITADQFRNALRNLGVENTDRIIKGDESVRFDVANFKRLARKYLIDKM
eukprot:TRINITY_DN3273_c0_g1_i1.p1 TRINITY_DN3273_c0_g1~~TRINITY_DN3273_c0_g1_i1.p1  ORF type:complete len:182 (-),score=46.81 TRINITY_DN3273_c0_g1_i1:54-521(-)